MAVRRGSARAVVGLAPLLGALLICAALGRTVGAQAEQIATTLHPGWNMVGWIHEETPASDLFEQLDSLESVYDGSGRSALRSAADDDSLTLQPGQGYWLRIDAEQPLKWTRPAEPSTLRFQLEAGDQLVAWAGPSERSIDDVLLGLRDQISVAWRWLAAEQRFVPWSPSPDVPTVEMPAMDRGDAVQINLLEPAEWLHPTGDLPQIQFAGGLHHQLPDNFREMVESDLRFVVERFVAKLQFEVPADRVQLRVPTTSEAEARERAKGLLPTTARAWTHSPAIAGGLSTIVMPWYIWPEEEVALFDRLNTPTRAIVAHEYFHVLQYELSGTRIHQTPGWLTEGMALWSTKLLFDLPIPNFDKLQSLTEELELLSRTDPYDLDHNLGYVATGFLVRRAGLESVVEFWRNFDSRTNPNQSWRIVFARTFGATFTEFAAEFYEYRRPLFGAITGRFHDPDDRSLSHLYIRALGWWPLGDESFGSIDLTVDVAYDGAFDFPLTRIGPGTSAAVRYTLFLGRRDDGYCSAQLMPDGKLLWRHAHAYYDDPITLPAVGQPDLNLDIQLPAGFCRHRFAVRLFGGYTVGQQTRVTYCFVETVECVGMHRQSSGQFQRFVPFPGDYLIRVADSRVRCGAYVTAEGGFTEDRAAAARFATSEGTTPVRVRLNAADDLCSPDSLEE